VNNNQYNPYTVQRCLAQLKKSTKIADNIGIICDAPIQNFGFFEENMHLRCWSSFKKHSETQALSRAFPYLQPNDSVAVCESDLLILKEDFAFSESVFENIDQYHGLARHTNLSDDLAGSAALRAPIMAKNALNDEFWTGLGANILEMYGHKNCLDMLVKKVKHRSCLPTAISASGSDLPMENWLFEDDDFWVCGHHGNKMQWSDSFTNGLKSQAQYSFRKATLIA
jgi:hypothetical protein